MIERIAKLSTAIMALFAAAAANAQTTQTVAVGRGPFAVVVNETTHKAYIATGEGISVVDGNAKVLASIKTATGVAGIAINPVTNRIYTAHPNDSTSTIIDGATDTVPVPPSTEPGEWAPTPPAFAPYLLPQWAFLTPFAMTDPAQFRPPGPPALNTAEWSADYQLTQQYGSVNSVARTPDQSEIALFWADGAGTETPPGHWNHIATDLARTQGLSLEQNARLLALLNLALADAAIGAWDAKYHYNWWRPVTAIRAGDTDGNDATDADPTWTPYLVTPPFPEHTSGHSTFSGAAAAVLARFWGTDDVSFSTGSDFLPGVSRSFPSFSSAADEAGMSRIYGGIHFMSANIHGLAAGADIGNWVFDHAMRPRSLRFRP